MVAESFSRVSAVSYCSTGFTRFQAILPDEAASRIWLSEQRCLDGYCKTTSLNYVSTCLAMADARPKQLFGFVDTDEITPKLRSPCEVAKLGGGIGVQERNAIGKTPFIGAIELNENGWRGASAPRCNTVFPAATCWAVLDRHIDTAGQLISDARYGTAIVKRLTTGRPKSLVNSVDHSWRRIYLYEFTFCFNCWIRYATKFKPFLNTAVEIKSARSN